MGLTCCRGVVAAATAALFLSVIGTAAASRPPTAAEASGIRSAIERFVEKPGSPAHGSTLRRIRVSTVDQRYAMARLRSPEAAVLATAVLERRGSGWRIVTFGIAGFAFKGVPKPVLNDLLGASICDCQ
jgi:hypothetical protein